MHDLEPIDSDDDGTVFRDVIMLALLGFVTIVVLLLPHLNPPVKATEPVRPPGNVVVEVRWPDELDTNVDLWVQAPGDVPVGYSNRGGQIFNLLRDDLGHPGDATGLNYEVAYSRGTPAGRYAVNLHLYRNTSGSLPVRAVVVVSVKADANSPQEQIATEHVELVRLGQELTVVRFTLDKAGNLVPDSVHQLPRRLRSAPS